MTPAATAAVEIAKLVVGAVAEASVVGLKAALAGGSLDESLAASIEHLADVRAKAKFPEYREG